MSDFETYLQEQKAAIETAIADNAARFDLPPQSQISLLSDINTILGGSSSGGGGGTPIADITAAIEAATNIDDLESSLITINSKLPSTILDKIPVISDINPSSLPGETNEGELTNITTKESLRRVQGSFSNVLDAAGEFYQFNFDTTRSICIQYEVIVGASSSIEIQFQFSANTTGTFFTNVSAENTNITYTESTVDSVIIQDLPAGLIRLTVINVTGTAQITSSVYAAHN